MEGEINKQTNIKMHRVTIVTVEHTQQVQAKAWLIQPVKAHTYTFRQSVTYTGRKRCQVARSVPCTPRVLTPKPKAPQWQCELWSTLAEEPSLQLRGFTFCSSVLMRAPHVMGTTRWCKAATPSLPPRGEGLRAAPEPHVPGGPQGVLPRHRGDSWSLGLCGLCGHILWQIQSPVLGS